MEIEDASPKLDGFNVKCHHPDISLDSNAYLEIMLSKESFLILIIESDINIYSHQHGCIYQ